MKLRIGSTWSCRASDQFLVLCDRLVVLFQRFQRTCSTKPGIVHEWPFGKPVDRLLEIDQCGGRIVGAKLRICQVRERMIVKRILGKVFQIVFQLDPGGRKIFHQVAAFGNAIPGLRDVGILRIVFNKRSEFVASRFVVFQIDQGQPQVKPGERHLFVLVVGLGKRSKSLCSSLPATLFVQADGEVVFVESRVSPHSRREK